jgi:hypothetical protein
LTVEDASHAEAADGTSGDRAHERVAPQSAVRGRCPDVREFSGLARDALQYRRRRIHKCIVDAQGARREHPSLNGERDCGVDHVFVDEGLK